jgi:small-conductance mechanosensitive channel
VGNLFGAELAKWLGKFVQVVNEPFFESGSTRISIVTLLFTIPIFYLASLAAKVARSFVDTTLLGRLSVDDAKKFTISSLIRYGVMGLVVLVGLSVIGIDLSALAVIFGFLGIGLGFGLQGVVSNFFAGLVIIFTRPIKEGDRVLASGHEGTVVQIRMLNAAINTLTNETIIIPNSELISSAVHNYSYLDRRVIIVNAVQVAYGSDLDRVVKVLYETAIRNPHALADPPPIIRVASFGESGIDMEVRTWIEDVSYKLVALSWTNLEIWRAFKGNGIQIPFPQVDLHVVPPPAPRTRAPDAREPEEP